MRPLPTIPALRRAAVAALASLLALSACKEATLGPEATGTIEGRVVHAETSQAIQGATITTSPPTSAPLTGSDGRFSLGGIEVGEYNVTARKSGFENASVSISVRENRATTVNLTLDPDESASVNAEVSNWWTSTGEADSSFVDVEYRVSNPSSATVATYEIYFGIYTPEGVFRHEEEGEDLRPDQSDLRTFRRFIRENEPDSVIIEEIWFEEDEG